MRNIIRITKSLRSKGKLIYEDELISHVNSDTSFYQSLYYYPEDSLEYFEQHKSIKGYKGEVYTPFLIFDVDSDDLEVSREATIKIINTLTELGLYKELASRISFSGSKGYHLYVRTDYNFDPKELKGLCKTIAKKAGVKIDTTIYNVNRIIRIVNTTHEKSGLHKIDVLESDFRSMTSKEIQAYAKTTQEAFDITESIDLSSVKTQLVKTSTKKKEEPVQDYSSIFAPTNALRKSKLNIEDYPCYNKIQKGDIGSGESNTAMLRLATFYKNFGFTLDECRGFLISALHARVDKFPHIKSIDDEKLDYEILNPVYESGYSYTVTDEYLLGKCKGEVCKLHNPDIPNTRSFKVKEIKTPPQKASGFSSSLRGKKEVSLKDRGFESFTDTAKGFREFAENIEKWRIKTGIAEIDDYCMIIPNGLTIINARPGVGKCHGLNIPIMMYDGTVKKVQDVKVGEQLMGPDSKPRNVLSLARGRQEMFEINPVKGESWTCNRDHILSLKCSGYASKKYKNGGVYNMSVDEYLQLSPGVQRRMKQYRTPVEFNSKPIPFAPYLIGAWLAEGSVGYPVMHCSDKELIDEVERLTPKDLTFRKFSLIKGCHKFSITTKRGDKNYFLDYIRDNCYKNKEKRIPQEYLANSRKNRLELLGAICDGDGYLYHKTFEIVTKYEGLKNDIVYLAQTLGFCATFREKKVKLKTWDTARTYYRVFISGETSLIPTKVPRKQAEERQLNKDVLNTGFSLESIGEGDYYGFQLDGDHLYCLGDTTVTHNTSLVLNMLKNSSIQGVKTIFYCADMEKDEFLQKVKSNVLGISPDDVFKLYTHPKYRDMISESDAKIGDVLSNVFPCYENRLNVTKIESDLQYFAEKGEKIGGIFIDYVQKMEGCHDYGNGVDNMIKLKDLVSRYKVPIILLSQIPRIGGNEETPIETASAAKGGSIYEETASIVINLWRPLKFCPTPGADKVIAFKIAKNRMGETPPIQNLYFEGKTGTIRSMTPEEYAEFELNKVTYDEVNAEKRKGKFR